MVQRALPRPVLSVAAMILAACAGGSSKSTGNSNVSATLSTLQATPASVTADGAAQVTVSVVVLEPGGSPAPNVTVAFAASGTANLFSPASATTDAAGHASSRLASTRAEAKTISAVAGGVTLQQTAQASFTAGPPSGGASGFTVAPATLLANGTATADLTATVRDAHANPVGGATVTFVATGAGNTITPSAVSSVTGVATGTIASTAAGSKTVTASVGGTTLGTPQTVVFSNQSYRIGGAVSGLVGSGLLLATAGQADLPVAPGSTTFTFASPVADGTAYGVTVARQPSGPTQTCLVAGGSGTVAGADVSTVAVTCQEVALDAGSVLEHHNGPRRAGVYVDPAWTRAAAATTHRDGSLMATVTGHVYSQPLYLGNGPGGKDVLVVATESNEVSALDAATGAPVWRVVLGAPVALSRLPCGNIDPLGITGTPVVDPATRTIYLDAMTTPDGGATKHHKVFALSVDDGSVRAGWPVEVNGVTSGAATFDSTVQNQRGALALVGGRVYVPYGGHFGDCGNYHGWLVGIDTANPSDVRAWATGADGGGSWAPSGVASDGTSLFLSTGNTAGTTVWNGGEAILRMSAGPVFSGATSSYFAPSNWVALDNADLDIGGTGPVLIDLPGATPFALTAALGKNGLIYLLDRDNLGGVGGQLSSLQVSSNEIVTAAATWTGAAGATVAFRGNGVGCPAGQGGDLVALLIPPSAAPTASVRWCAGPYGMGSPMVTTTDGSSESIVWTVGAENDNRLRGINGDTGAEIFGGGGAGDGMGQVRRYTTPILAKGRIFVAGDGAVYAFTR